MVAVVLLLIDRRYFHMFAYPAYVVGILLLLACLAFGREVNGAKAWFEFGGIRVQPVEFAKIATALMMARVMSSYSFNIKRFSDLVKVAAVILIPLAIIVKQNDTGSGIVLGSFIFVFYREGLNKWLCIPILLVALLFIVSFLVTPTALLVSLIVIFTLSEMMMNRVWRSRVVALAAVFLEELVFASVFFAELDFFSVVFAFAVDFESAFFAVDFFEEVVFSSFAEVFSTDFLAFLLVFLFGQQSFVTIISAKSSPITLESFIGTFDSLCKAD